MAEQEAVEGIHLRRIGPKEALLVSALTAIALALRLPGLDSGLWLDEILSLLESYRMPLGTVVKVFPGDTQHPLYAVSTNISVMAFGEANWVLRLPALLFGVATVPLLYIFARAVTSRREAAFASILLTVSYHHVWFSQNARGYTMLAFWTLLCSLLLWHGLDAGSWPIWAGYGTAAAFGMYTHLTMVFVVASHALVALFVPARSDVGGGFSRRGPVLGLALAGLLSLLLYSPMITQVLDFFLNQPSDMTSLSTPGWALAEAVRVLESGLGISALVVAVATGLWGVASYARSNRLALSLYLLPALLLAAGSMLGRGTLYPRFFFALAGFGILITVRGIADLGGWLGEGVASRSHHRRVGDTVATALLVGLVVASAISLPRNYLLPKQDFEGAARWVTRNALSTDIIITAGVAIVPYRDYLSKPWIFLGHGEGHRVQELREAGHRVWVIYTLPRYLRRSHPRLWDLLEEGCSDERRFRGTLGGGDIVVCTLEPLSLPGEPLTP